MEKIKKLLDEYDLILIVVDDSQSSCDGLINRLKQSKALTDTNKKIAIISSYDNEDIKSLFYTYEFSDKIKMVGKSSQYGGLFNLVELGLISEEEAFEAIIGS